MRSLVCGRRCNGEHSLADTGYADHCALTGHMLKELAALGGLDAEGLDIGSFLTDVGNDADVGNQGVVIEPGMTGTFVIVHY